MPLSTNWPEGVGRQVVDETDSTNALAMRLAPTLAGPLWLLALSQTAARGRRGRAWVGPKGNFAATYVMAPPEPPAQVALRSFVASLALFDAMAQATGRRDGLSLKWPNDVLLNGGKVAGILLESTGVAGQVAHLAIGIGVNLAQAPEIRDIEPRGLRPVALAGETGVLLTPQEFLDILAPAYAHWEHQFTTLGFAPIRSAWLARAARMGQMMTARTGTQELTGTFDTIDEAGCLILSTAKGRREIPAGEVFF